MRTQHSIARGRAREGEEKTALEEGKPDAKAKNSTPSHNVVTVRVKEGDDEELRTAETLIGPLAPNAFALTAFSRGTIGEVKLDKVALAMAENARQVRGGDMSSVEAVLLTQATVLNGLFADLTRRAANNLGNGHTFEAGEKLFKMALRAQSQCRATLETLATVKNPPVVFAKQANIANGPQQVNNGPLSPPRAENPRIGPNELLERTHEQPLDA